MKRPGVAATLLWVVLAGLAVVVVARASYTADLSAFLPRKPTAAQQLLVDQLREGIASRLIIIAIEGTDSATRARLSTSLARRLRGDAEFTAISNGEAVALDRDRDFLFEHRYVLSASVTPERFTVAGLERAMQETLDLLSSSAGLLVKPLLVRDPTGEMVQIAGAASGGKQPRTIDGVWASQDGKRALLLAQTRAAGFDADGQQRAIGAIRRAFEEALAQVSARDRSGAALKMTGPGVFSVAARAIIEHEVVRLSILSIVLIMGLLSAGVSLDVGASAWVGASCLRRARGCGGGRSRFRCRARDHSGFRHHSDRRVGRLFDLSFHSIAGERRCIRRWRRGCRRTMETHSLADHTSRRVDLDLWIRSAAAVELPRSRPAWPLFDHWTDRRRAGHAVCAALVAAPEFCDPRCRAPRTCGGGSPEACHSSARGAWCRASFSPF